MKLYEALNLGKKELVCFIGAGGKTGLMQKLTGECAQQGGRVLVTTSTKMFRPQLADCGPLIMEENEDELFKRLLEASASDKISAAARGMTVNNKVEGLPIETIDRLFNAGLFDYLLVEADGANCRALKAPASFEPQVPEQATCVVVIAGIDVLGRPLTEEYVHRHQIAAEISGQVPGTPVTATTILSIFKYYRQILNKTCTGIRLVPVLNKVDDTELLQSAKEVAKELIPEMGMVLMTSTLLPEPVQEVVV